MDVYCTIGYIKSNIYKYFFDHTMADIAPSPIFPNYAQICFFSKTRPLKRTFHIMHLQMFSSLWKDMYIKYVTKN